MLLIRKSMFVISATLLCQMVSSGDSSCTDDFNLNYTLPTCFKCEVIMTNGCGIPLIPKLIHTGIATKHRSGRHDGIPAIYTCRIPDCYKNPCVNGWCQEELTNYTCHCPPEFAGKHCEFSCQSNPCLHGGNCTVTAEGFQCNCTTEYYGLTCACQVIQIPDRMFGSTGGFLVPALEIVRNVTSFDFEVSANKNALVALSRSNEAVRELMYHIYIGANAVAKTAGYIFRQYENGSRLTTERIDPALGLSGTPLYDQYHVSFANGHIGIYRPGNDTPLMEIIDLDPLEVNYVGIMTGCGTCCSVGYWKFPSLCS